MSQNKKGEQEQILGDNIFGNILQDLQPEPDIQSLQHKIKKYIAALSSAFIAGLSKQTRKKSRNGK